MHLSEEQEKIIRKAFRNPDKKPKILIVTEKLLTGFDAPILYCMYLDKPMRDHVHLQAIARVNRPYEDSEGRKKPCPEKQRNFLYALGMSLTGRSYSIGVFGGFMSCFAGWRIGCLLGQELKPTSLSPEPPS